MYKKKPATAYKLTYQEGIWLVSCMWTILSQSTIICIRYYMFSSQQEISCPSISEKNTTSW